MIIHPDRMGINDRLEFKLFYCFLNTYEIISYVICRLREDIQREYIFLNGYFIIVSLRDDL